MKRLVTTMILTCAISSSALAGDIPSDGSPTPRPIEGTQTAPPAPGDIPSGGIADQLSSDALAAFVAALGFLA